MPTGTGDFELTKDELRVVVRYAVESAQEVLPLFEQANPGDHRPRAAIDAAWTFATGAARTKLQRVTALDAHRAAKEVASEASQHAARAAGDAASAAYLHPLAKATQVGHILRAAAGTARAAELSAGDDFNVGNTLIEQARQRATPALIDDLSRYLVAPSGKSRVAHLDLVSEPGGVSLSLVGASVIDRLGSCRRGSVPRRGDWSTTGSGHCSNH